MSEPETESSLPFLVLLVLGAAAIVVPAIATLAYAIFVGWLFLIAGAVGLATTFWMRNAPGFWWSLLSAALAIAVGVALIGWPHILLRRWRQSRSARRRCRPRCCGGRN